MQHNRPHAPRAAAATTTTATAATGLGFCAVRPTSWAGRAGSAGSGPARGVRGREYMWGSEYMWLSASSFPQDGFMNQAAFSD